MGGVDRAVAGQDLLLQVQVQLVPAEDAYQFVKQTAEVQDAVRFAELYRVVDTAAAFWSTSIIELNGGKEAEPSDEEDEPASEKEEAGEPYIPASSPGAVDSGWRSEPASERLADWEEVEVGTRSTDTPSSSKQTSDWEVEEGGAAEESSSSLSSESSDSSSDGSESDSSS